MKTIYELSGDGYNLDFDEVDGSLVINIYRDDVHLVCQVEVNRYEVLALSTCLLKEFIL